MKSMTDFHLAMMKDGWSAPIYSSIVVGDYLISMSKVDSDPCSCYYGQYSVSVYDKRYRNTLYKNMCASVEQALRMYDRRIEQAERSEI